MSVNAIKFYADFLFLNLHKKPDRHYSSFNICRYPLMSELVHILNEPSKWDKFGIVNIAEYLQLERERKFLILNH